MSLMMSRALTSLTGRPEARRHVSMCLCKLTVRKFRSTHVVTKWRRQTLRNEQKPFLSCTSGIHPSSTLWTKKSGQETSSTTNERAQASNIEPSSTTDDKTESEQTDGIGIFRRFRVAYKEHGKVLIGVHLVTSAIWTGAFYYATINGIDVTPLLVKLGASQKVVDYLSSSVGNLATTYVMYKIATPARYTVTIFGTYTTVRYLRKWGYMAPPSQEDSIRNLVKEKYGDIKDDVKEKYVDLKDDVKDKYGDMKGEVKDKLKSKVGMSKKKS